MRQHAASNGPLSWLRHIEIGTAHAVRELICEKRQVHDSVRASQLRLAAAKLAQVQF
jgi:hypothetical protein